MVLKNRKTNSMVDVTIECIVLFNERRQSTFDYLRKEKFRVYIPNNLSSIY